MNGRDLPWRKTTDPYAILVSEILSHQTQIARVVPVYQQVLKRYPTVQNLARAEATAVKAITDPLGYKVRGRWLHEAALLVADRFGGAFPATAAGLRQLPGVGPYTAGALISFAFRRDTPAVDTNVARVLRRYFGVGAPRQASDPAVRQLAQAVIPRGKGCLFNQALMDLGAMICRARNPSCGSCPVQRGCRAASAAATVRPSRRADLSSRARQERPRPSARSARAWTG